MSLGTVTTVPQPGRHDRNMEDMNETRDEEAKFSFVWKIKDFEKISSLQQPHQMVTSPPFHTGVPATPQFCQWQLQLCQCQCQHWPVTENGSVLTEESVMHNPLKKMNYLRLHLVLLAVGTELEDGPDKIRPFEVEARFRFSLLESDGSPSKRCSDQSSCTKFGPVVTKCFHEFSRPAQLKKIWCQSKNSDVQNNASILVNTGLNICCEIWGQHMKFVETEQSKNLKSPSYTVSSPAAPSVSIERIILMARSVAVLRNSLVVLNKVPNDPSKDKTSLLRHLKCAEFESDLVRLLTNYVHKGEVNNTNLQLFKDKFGHISTE